MAAWICKNGHRNESAGSTYPTHCLECGAYWQDGGEWVEPFEKYNLMQAPYISKPNAYAISDSLHGNWRVIMEVAIRAFIRELEQTMPWDYCDFARKDC